MFFMAGHLPLSRSLSPSSPILHHTEISSSYQLIMCRIYKLGSYILIITLHPLLPMLFFTTSIYNLVTDIKFFQLVEFQLWTALHWFLFALSCTNLAIHLMLLKFSYLRLFQESACITSCHNSACISSINEG